MAEAADRAGSVDKSNKHVNLQQKRKSDKAFEGHDSSPVKKQKDVKEGIQGKDGGKLPVKKPFAMGISMNLSGPKKSGPIKMTMPSQVQDKKDSKPLLPKSGKVASVFNEDSESDEEEMPPEAKMRMRNVGRETPTAAGPNSFGKGNLGFCDRNKMIERELKKQMQEYGEKADIDKLDKT